MTASSPGLRLCRQAPAATDARIDDPPFAPTDLWRALFDPWHTQVPQRLVDALRTLADGQTRQAFRRGLDDLDALGGVYATVAEWLLANPESDAFWDGLAVTRALGAGKPLGLSTSLRDIRAGPLEILARADHVPTVAIRLGESFTDVRADQRREWCRLLADLAEVCDVRLICSTYVARHLAQTHREQLPGVTEQYEARLSGGSPTEELVAAARDDLDPDGRVVAILRRIADASSETRSYHALYADATVSKSRVRQAISQLASLGLVEPFDGPDGKHAELKQAGREFLDTVDEEIGRQRRLDDSVSEPGNVSDNAVYSERTRAREGSGDPDRYRLPHLHEVAYLRRQTHAAAVGSAPANGVGLVNHPIQPKDDRGEPGWSYDAAADRLVVSAEYDGPLQYWVCVALALTSERTWEHVLTDDRLDDGKLGEFVAEYKETLRGSRCLGHLPNRVETGCDYRDELREARDDLYELTQRLANEEYEDRSRFRGTITREALGLAGTMTHVLDLVGVELVREVRVPEFSKSFDSERQDELCASLAIGLAIGAKYGESVAYRQLFESRDDKRRDAIKPTVDASDPVGKCIGSWTVVGNFGNQAESFRERLIKRLSDPEDVHDEAPEFSVRLPVRVSHQRPSFETVAHEMCRSKGLLPTHESVSLLHALARTPYDAAAALDALDPTDGDSRPIRVGEVRFALAHLPPERLLRGLTPTPRKAVAVLLRADGPLSEVAIADHDLGPSRRSLTDHLSDLCATALVEETDDGYRLGIAYNHGEEREESRMPLYAYGGATGAEIHLAAQCLRRGNRWLRGDVEVEAIDAPGPPHPRPWCLDTPEPWIHDILPALWGVAAHEKYDADEFFAAEATVPVEFGAPLEQQPLGGSDGEEVTP